MKKIIIAGMLLCVSLFMQACGGPSKESIEATAQSAAYQKVTEEAVLAKQTAILQTETAMEAAKAELAITQTAMAIPTATLTPTQTPQVVSEDTSCPLYVYQDWSADTRFVPEGYMGDISDINLDDNFKLDSSRPNTIKIDYKAKGSQGWAGIYWWVPGTSWGNGNDVGLNISCATKLTFWARGEKGNEKAEFKIGGIKGTYRDSLEPALSSGPLVLTQEWVQYTIDLSGKDLSHIMGGFVWVTKASANPKGAVIYIDDVKFEQ